MDWPSDEASFRIKTNIGVLGNAHTCVEDLTYVRWPFHIGAFFRERVGCARTCVLGDGFYQELIILNTKEDNKRK